MKKYLFSLLVLLLPSYVSAQQSRILGGNILTLRTEVGGRLNTMPILQLDGDKTMEISFDEMSHEYHRYLYRIQHCDLYWNDTQDLFFSEFMEATQEEVPIDDYVESQNVTTHYTHYSFEFPNEDMHPLLSGNYRMTILCDDGDEPEPVAEVCFCMLESKVGIIGEVTTNTELDYNSRHQQVEMSIDCSNLQTRDLREEIHTLVMQNDRLDNAVFDARPSYVNGSKLIWEHQRELTFPAGNEYRKYEILSYRYPSMHVDNINFFAPYLHATIDDDAIRRNYLTDEDLNGISVIRNIDNQDDIAGTEYMLTHFKLLCPEPFEDADVFINGKWTTGGISKEWKLTYDDAQHAYVGAFMLKQGYYNYQYLVVSREDQLKRTVFHQPKGYTRPLEGDFYQTSNDYRVLVYFRQPGARYDRLVGMSLLKF